jgi:hypothetical protein
MKQIMQNRIETISRNGSTFLPKGLFHTTPPAGSFSRTIPMSKRIKLTQGKYAIVDNVDYEWINQYKWCASYSRGYWRAERGFRENGKQHHIEMHRFIMSPPKDMVVDHKDHNRFNNQRSNLRIATRSENQRNSLPQKGHKYKGPHLTKQKGRWASSISVNRKGVHLGRFNSKKEAAIAYDNAAKQYFGEFACLNFPGDVDG